MASRLGLKVNEAGGWRGSSLPTSYAVELLGLELRLPTSGWQALAKSSVYIMAYLYGKCWHVFLDGVGTVFRLFLQPEAHNHVFILFLRGIYFNNSL